MLTEIEQLLRLQERDLRIEAMRRDLHTLPRRQDELKGELGERLQAYRLEESKVQENELEVKRLELEAATKREAIAKLKRQMMETRKNDEYQAFVNEIGRFEAELSRLEERELEAMEVAEEARGRLGESELVLKSMAREVKVALGVLDEQIRGVKGRLTELEAERSGLTTGLDEDLLARYERILEKKGSAAVVPMEEGSCGGCHMKATTSVVHEVRAGRQLVFCPNCGRFLYWAG